MPYQDTSPAGQHFMNFSRPLSLAVVARAADYLTFELIYGFGEYRFHADPARHDSLADLARLADALEAGFDYVEATFADAGGHTRLILQGDGDVLQFACYDSADAVLPWLQGDAGRLAFARNVRSLLND
ncbi:hypothetical protein [Cardiobacterium hominis]|jgi:hypothetical protein|uniref:hypothetical protein n=1 Tax=Cardiobacterium hominis TaxID=2718 RepID=UPI0006603F21|nr:hypothetical protein [Cardiobacterium hominis]RKW19792.1 MAG: hypothetical protein D8H94_00235 [Cardiobacterium sp.]